MPSRVRKNNTRKTTQKPRKTTKKLSKKKQQPKCQSKHKTRRQSKKSTLKKSSRQSKKSIPKKLKKLKKYNAKGGRTGTGGSIGTTIDDMLATGASLADTIGSATALVMDAVIFPFDMGVAFLAANPPNPGNTGMI